MAFWQKSEEPFNFSLQMSFTEDQILNKSNVCHFVALLGRIREAPFLGNGESITVSSRTDATQMLREHLNLEIFKTKIYLPTAAMLFIFLIWFLIYIVIILNDVKLWIFDT